jgi:hypothetical protein
MRPLALRCFDPLRMRHALWSKSEWYWRDHGHRFVKHSIVPRDNGEGWLRDRSIDSESQDSQWAWSPVLFALQMICPLFLLAPISIPGHIMITVMWAESWNNFILTNCDVFDPSSAAITNIRIRDTRDDFIVDIVDSKSNCPSVRAQFVSPPICRQHYIDPSITKYAFEAKYLNDQFHILLSLVQVVEIAEARMW